MSDIEDRKACIDCDRPLARGNRAVILTQSDAKYGTVYVCETCALAQPETFESKHVMVIP